ncbi:hypothetical protein [Xiashengella succiniciproducens]|uniref:Uncharacterized protein n=1 Tax=Xiashengella succiniciproducens TaxID=2949635 RepID=A0A9J6ZNX7_9BACT|nr:hypothetical protein [Alkaliflexus sp. Ai-910]URW79215.1 hypothetical protein M9189_10150 [Alkaliflexus sp. Ai-910]
MKSIYKLLSMFVVAALVLGSCDEFEDKDSISPVMDESNQAVRFLKANPGIVVIAYNALDFEVTVVRSKDADAISVSLRAVKNAQYFNVPATVEFPKGVDTVVVALSAKEDAPQGSNISLVLELDDNFANPYLSELPYYSATVFIKPPCTLNELKLAITFDGYGSETTWKLTDEEGEEVFKGGPYKDGQASAEEYFCVPDGKYTFTVYDEYGDGLSFPKDGLVSLTLGELVILEAEGDFGASASSTFTMTDGELVLDAGDDEGDE